ncbi:MAG: family 78 glycoside hydrolase catalytic domain [Dorea sp.]
MKEMNLLFVEPEKEAVMTERHNASYVRKEFVIQKEVKKANLLMTACGVYKAYLNGEEVDDQCFLPGFTCYQERLQYQEYDVTDQLVQGTNVIGAVIGDGWYRGRLGLLEKTNFYGDKTKFLCVLDIEYEDGSVQKFTTDTSWRAIQNGPLGKNDLKTGEEYDATKEMPGWNLPGFDDNDWSSVYEASYDGKLVPSEGEKILEHEHFTPTVLHTPDGNTVLDFGQNISGYMQFKVTGKAGQKVRLTHGETLDEHGNFTLKNLQLEGEMDGKQELGEAFGQVNLYTLKDGEQVYKPMFSSCGFQYVKLEFWPEEVKPENFEAIAVYSDVRVNAEWECSNELINRLVENVKWSQKSNFLDIPTDCPTRERAGWTGDIAAFVESACYLSDPKKFLLKWMEDVAIEQKKDGCAPFMVPDLGLGEIANAWGSAGWADVVYIVPYTLYKFYGDVSILEKYYDNMKQWVEYNRKRAMETHPLNAEKTGEHRKYILDTGFHFGEWLEPGSVMLEDTARAMQHPDEEVATAYYGYSAKVLSEIAGILGKKEDEEEYRELFHEIQTAYQKEYIQEGSVVSDRQCRYVRPIMMDMVTEEQKKQIAADLNQKVIANDYKIGTGFLTTPNVLSVLTEYGYVDTAYKMLENTKQPGWLYAVTKGATTIWENWLGRDEHDVPRDSMNHYAPGSVVAWLFNTCAGIRPVKPGFEKIEISPVPGGTLRYAKAKVWTCKGWIRSEWSIEGEQFKLFIEVPEETEVHMPDGTEYIACAGSWEYVCGL